MRRLLLATMLVIAALASAQAFAAGWIEDFEGYTAGSPLPSTYWTADTGTNSGYTMTPGTVVSTVAKSGSNSWECGTAPAPKEASHIKRGIGQAVGDEISVSAWFYRDPGSSYRGFIGFQNGFAVDMSMVRFGLNLGATPTFAYYDDGNVLTYKYLSGIVLQENAWYMFDLTMDRVEDTADWDATCTVTRPDGTSVSATYTFPWEAANASDVVVGYIYGSVAGLKIDDVALSIPDVPEPGSMLALGTGLIGLFGFIRRKRT